jgi:hypothetical protein
MYRSVHLIGKDILAPLCGRPRWKEFPQLTDSVKNVTCGTCLQIIESREVVDYQGKTPEKLARCFQRMARRMAALIPKTQIPMDEFIRADGQCVCQQCGLYYRDHPEVANTPTFHILCSGRVIKT